jgi:alpha-1,2-mannosyltransferase
VPSKPAARRPSAWPGEPSPDLAISRLHVAMWAIPLGTVLAFAVTAAIVSLLATPGIRELPSPLQYTSLHAAFRAIEMNGTDSWHPMLVARAWLAANPGGDVYAALASERGIKFQYPATTLLLAEILPTRHEPAVLLLNLANLAMAGALVGVMGAFAVALARRTIPALLYADPRIASTLAAIAALATVLYYPLMRALAIGQIQVALTLLLVLACHAWVERRSVLAGALIGLSALVKPPMALMLLWALLRRDWRMAGAGLAVVALGLAAAVALYGTGWIDGYLRLLAHIATHGEAYFANQSLNGLLNRWLATAPNLDWLPTAYAAYHPVVHTLTFASAIVFIGLAMAQAFRGDDELTRAAAFTATAIAITMAAPVTWEHQYGALLPGFAVALVAVLATPPGKPSGWPLLAAAYLVAANVLSATNWLAASWLNPLQSYLFLAALALLALLLRPQPPAAAR